MKKIATTAAVGQVLCHDVTQIIRGVSKGARFLKGHIIQAEDIPVLLSMGKDHVYIWEKDASKLHENEAADKLRQLCQNEYMAASAVREGKIELTAERDGLLKVDIERLNAVNDLEEIMIATRHNNTPVRAGDKLAGMRVIPLVIDKKRLETAAQLVGRQPLISLLPYKKFRVGVVTTGNEVFHGRIKDTFTPVIAAKLAEFGLQIEAQLYSDDNYLNIKECAEKLLAQGMELLIFTGGMSVDPDDMTPAAIKSLGAAVVTYGAPVLPGAMFMLAYKDDVPVMGLPGCVMYAKTTIFDLILPRVLAGERLSRRDLTVLGHGGLCLGCAECRYPACSFGKGC